MNINEICEKASEIEKHFGWPTQPIPKTLELALTHITQLEAENERLRRAGKTLTNRTMPYEDESGVIKIALAHWANFKNALSKEENEETL